MISSKLNSFFLLLASFSTFGTFFLFSFYVNLEFSRVKQSALLFLLLFLLLLLLLVMREDHSLPGLTTAVAAAVVAAAADPLGDGDQGLSNPETIERDCRINTRIPVFRYHI